MGYKGDLAKNYFLEGYNCTQSVVLAFADEMKLDKSSLIKMASPFGGGMGRLREVCGTVSGMYIVLGYFYGYDFPKATTEKKELYEKVQNLAQIFRENQGSIICRELLGEKGNDTSPIPDARTSEYYSKRPCPMLAAYAADLLDEFMKEHPASDHNLT